MRTCSLVIALIFAVIPAPAAAKDYAAERYDSKITVLPGGALEVTETVVFRFNGGPFTQVYRQIPGRRTDGIEIVRASMDGVLTPEGEGPGHLDIDGSSRVRVKWRFAPVADSSHTFEVTYIARGVVRKEDSSDAEGAEVADLVNWLALPAEHAYRIASSTVDIYLPAVPIASPMLSVRRVERSEVGVAGTHVRITAHDVRKNGWVQIAIRLPRGSVIDAPPEWQRHAQDVVAGSRRWILAAAAVFAIGLVVLFWIRQGYDSPPRDAHVIAAGPGLPDSLPPAIAGALVTNGSARLEHAMAALFSLAQRGEIRIEEQAKSFGQRVFTITRMSSGRPVSDLEKALYDTIFESRKGRDSSVSLSTARSRLAGHSKAFNAAVAGELARAGLVDEGRREVRNRYGRIAVMALIVAGVAIAPAAFAIRSAGAWPFLIPAAIGLVSIVAGICMAAHTPLSNEAVRRAGYWRGFQQHLRDIARDRAAAPPDAEHLLPFAVALGVAGAWAKFLKNHKASVPRWFNALAASEGNPAFVALVSTGGAAHTGGHGGAGAAGGGASGAS